MLGVSLLAAACSTGDGTTLSEPPPTVATTTTIPPPTSALTTIDIVPSTIANTTTTTSATTTEATTTTTLPPEPRVLLVGDSTLLAVETYQAELGLQGFDAVLEVKSCRTLGVPSCGSPPVPPNSVETIRGAEGPFDGVVIMAGYDEWWTSFASSFETVMEVSRDQGAKWVLWLAYPEDVPYLVPDGRTANESFVAINELLTEFDEDPAYDDLIVAQWPTYNAPADEWITGDGIHLSPHGAYGVADYLSRYIAHITGLPCPQPLALERALENLCVNPDELEEVADIESLYLTTVDE